MPWDGVERRRRVPVDEAAAILRDQREEDLERNRIEIKRARLDAYAEAHTAEQDRRLDAINGSVEKTAMSLAQVREEVRHLAGLIEIQTRVTEALSRRTASTRALVAGIVLPIVALILGLHHY
jgi:uncharacterized coiled-coil protein SlyX